MRIPAFFNIVAALNFAVVAVGRGTGHGAQDVLQKKKGAKSKAKALIARH